VTRSKDIGTETETAVVRYLQLNGFPYAERRALHGGKDLGDITGTPGIVWEVKGGKAAENAGDGLIEKWLDEAKVEAANAGVDAYALITKRKGYGATRVGDWWAWLPSLAVLGNDEYDFPVRVKVSDHLKMLKLWGYGGRE